VRGIPDVPFRSSQLSRAQSTIANPHRPIYRSPAGTRTLVGTMTWAVPNAVRLVGMVRATFDFELKVDQRCPKLGP
jgi:hypothetical protein